jgi:hypothetical protein
VPLGRVGTIGEVYGFALGAVQSMSPACRSLRGVRPFTVYKVAVLRLNHLAA